MLSLNHQYAERDPETFYILYQNAVKELIIFSTYKIK